MGRFKESADRSAKKVDEKFRKEIADLQMPTLEKLEKLFPEEVDRENLYGLLDVVRKSTDDMEAFNKLKENAKTLGVAVIKLAKAVALA